MDNAEALPPRPNDYMNRLDGDGEDEYVDHWDTGELLFLASSVLRSDRNWVSVARSIKPFGDQTRPADWYTPKNCALQYTRLLNEIEEDSKKKTLPRTERETSEVMLVKNLTEKRVNELTWLNQQTKTAYNNLKSYIEMVENGDFDENLDDLMKELDETDKIEEEHYKEYLTKRETLNASKRLNKSRITKGKGFVKGVVDSKKKMPSYSEPDESTHQQIVVDGLPKFIKREIISEEDSKLVTVKTELDNPGYITLNALLDSKVTPHPSAVAPTSPLLTSLLRNPGSTTPGSHSLSSSVSAHLKEIDMTDVTDIIIKKETETTIKIREISPRASVPQSPRPTPASSPLLNSLLKNSPSSSTTMLMSPGKEISPKAVSSPQPFFNPSSVLANAAAQQIALATSTHQFFQHEAPKVGLQTSPVTSACLSAPTLSKLLEMPPSTPGRLPPLPVLEPPVTPTGSTSASEPILTPQKPVQLLFEELKSTESSLKKMTVTKITSDVAFSSDISMLQKSLTSYSQLDKKNIVVGCASEGVQLNLEIGDQKSPFKFRTDVDATSQENIDILHAVCESINEDYEKKEIKKEIVDDDFACQEVVHTSTISSLHAAALRVDNIALEEEISSFVITDEFVEGLISEPKLADVKLSPEEVESILAETAGVKPIELPMDDDKSDDKTAAGRKFYKSRTSIKKEDSPEKHDPVPVILSPKKEPTTVSTEPETPPVLPVFDADSISPTPKSIAESIEFSAEKEDLKLAKTTEMKSPPLKKARLFDQSSAEKTELSDDEAPHIAVRRSGRRGKKGRGRIARSTPVKQAEPKDQYEFTESTEENSVGYQMSNTLCYMPRVKDDSRSEDFKMKDSEDAASTASSPVEKKVPTPHRAKQGRGGSHVNTARKNLFPSDEERMSDSLASDDASNHLLSEDKLKKWEETCDKKGDVGKSVAERTRTVSRGSDSSTSKKKPTPVKRSASGKVLPPRKERKLSNMDMEELSVGSRDSEGETMQEKDPIHVKDSSVPQDAMDLDVEMKDSHLSSSIVAEADKHIGDGEGCESLQGPNRADLSPPPISEAGKEEKDSKQDWFHGVSPKSSELVSQSSEESEEYESDNWDNNSASTSKSASHSGGAQPRLKRKERESSQYKAWKKAITIVLREASTHKNANIFLQKVTNDVAPGYLSIVHRPMDLSLIKRNIDNGVIRTTDEFHRDMLLMFQNAIMYNSSDHDVHQMAVEMQRDVVQQIHAFLMTQSDKDEVDEPPVSSLRGGRKSQKVPGKESVRSSSGKAKEDAD